MATVTEQPVAAPLKRWSFGRRRNGGFGQQLLQHYLQEEPIRASLLSLEQLTEHAQTLADWHQLAPRPRSNRLLAKLDENARILEEAFRFLSLPEIEGQELPPAGNWFLDNYYIIQDQVRMARQHLPRKYSMELPQLAGGASDGLPRVYDLALELISHVDGQVDLESLDRFVTAYQRLNMLNLGELWAIPIMLRLALIENLRRLVLRVMRHRQDQELGELWADRVIRAARESFGAFLKTVGTLANEDVPLSSAFVARFAQRVSGRLPKDNVAIQWLTQRLAENGQTIDGLVNLNSQTLAADQISMSNCITSLRSLGAMEWKDFVEGQSAVEQVLRKDPAGVYPAMDFASRDQYRHVIEKLARRSNLTEQQIARMAVELAQVASTQQARSGEVRARSEPTKRGHVGFYLVSVGRPQLEQSIGYRPNLYGWLARITSMAPLTCYLGSIALTWLLIVATAAALARGMSPQGLPAAPRLAVLLLFAFAAGSLAVSIVNWLATLIVRTRAILRLDFSGGVPLQHRTLVAIPTLLSDEEAARRLVDQLAVRYLANQDENILFALLTDFPDAPAETEPKDAALLAIVRSGIQRLNDQYCRDKPPQFYLFHRPRKFNPAEGVWMAEERKRGKLEALNRLLRTGATDAFQVTVGDLARLGSVRYVITLDTDTQLPRETAAKLIGSISHPLNRPQVDPRSGLVTEGYALLQPRISTTVPEANRSRYSQLFAGDAGIDPYTAAVSDVYQDIFGEGSFIGKGIYDVYAFDAALDGRFPPNRILSHDLIEGCYARSGLITDVELFEGFPSKLLADIARQHRWIRGDWQIAAWLGFRAPTATGRGPNPLSWLSRWKIFDNLRRSLTPVALLAFLFAGWLLLPHLAWLWTLLAAGLVFLTAIMAEAVAFCRKPEEKPWALHWRDQLRSFWHSIAREAIGLAILPYRVNSNLDAVGRTLYRLNISRRKLLEWVTMSEAEKASRHSLGDHYRSLWANVVSAGIVAAALAALAPWALVGAGPVLALWLAGPAIAWRLSQPKRHGIVRLTAAQTLRMRRWARQTWHFYDTFVTEQDHWLAPDNVLELDHWVVAPRTSPTNIGLALTADLAACDMGYLPASVFLERLGRTFHTLERLERYRGHLLNWYDTRTLKPLEPRYVSTVDSGNFWATLVILEVGLRELRQRPLVAPRLLEGLQDTLAVIAAQREGAARGDEFDSRLGQIQNECETALRGGCRRAWGLLGRVQTLAVELAARVPHEKSTLRDWVQALLRQCGAAHAELGQLAFWIHVPQLAETVYAGLDAELTKALAELRGELDQLDASPTLDRLPAAAEAVRDRVAALYEILDRNNGDDTQERHALRETLTALADWAESAATAAGEQLAKIDELTRALQQLSAMDFRFLYHPHRRLMSIGFNVTEHRRDNSFYDLLASEARVASFLAISHGQLSQEHWFALGRMVTIAEGRPTLLSWSGSMFEYLMPMLMMPSYPNTVLDVSCRNAVRRQIAFARRHGVPWGISESSYFLTDPNQSYRYRAFGVPGLGLQRGLGNQLVIAPYASAMSVIIAPREACDNLHYFEQRQCLSTYGFYDALDYTPQRRPTPDEPGVCRTVMAHHNGMALLAFTNVLLGGVMPRRFMRNRLCRAHDLLLQERLPSSVRPVDPQMLDIGTPTFETGASGRASLRAFDSPHLAHPEVHLLSNGTYHVALTNAGGGISRCRDLSVTRWREDPTRDCYGTFCYLRDLDSREFWSNTYQPTRIEPDKYTVLFSQGQVEYRLVYQEVDTQTQVAVSPEDNVEVRRLTITNLSRVKRTIEVTSYAEVVLAAQEADRAHRAFSNLFVQTEIHPEMDAILCTRRPRAPEEPAPWMFHLILVQAPRRSRVSFETSRERFVGRMRSVGRPIALESAEPLSGAEGFVLDPIVSLRQNVVLESEEAAVVHIISGVADSREQALAAVNRYHDSRLAARVFDMSRAQSQLNLQHLNMTEADAQTFAHLASALLYPDSRYRSTPTLISQSLRSQSALWSLGVSGDRPIVLVRCAERQRSRLVEQMLAAHAYWQGKGLQTDLVIWIETEPGYRQELFDHVMGLIAFGPDARAVDQPGGIFVRRSDEYPVDSLMMLEAVARISFDDAGGPLEEQVKPNETFRLALRQTSRAPRKEVDPRMLKRVAPELLFYNGIGGFTRDGREYIAVISPGKPAPAPWCNVLANPSFGTVVSDGGPGYTWADNSQQFRLTPWSNDPVVDPQSEVIYVQDDDSGELFSATPIPVSSPAGYLCRHGFGYSVWETTTADLDCQLWCFVGVERPVKFYLLTLKNTSSRRRKLSVAGYVEWVLGDHREKTGPYLITETDPRTGALLARNPFSLDFDQKVGIFHCSEPNRSATCDRAEFVGRNGTMASPAGLKRSRLSGKAGAAIDPAAAIRCRIELAPDEQRDIVFTLGAGNSVQQARELAQQMTTVAAARFELTRVWEQWNTLLGAIQVETPEASVNVMANGWLLYQSLACRFWGRSGFYQSGGAYGFRDQLQDSMSLLYAAPWLTRQHLIYCAGRQFREGDVQHWWHPPTGSGVRTHISDDFLWLPSATAKYVTTTGDWGVLDETAPFLVERRPELNEESVYSTPHLSDEHVSLYEHCCRAIRHALKFGAHGLPLMGSGDWNDGMNRVGADGKGESVWLAFFLVTVLRDFAELAEYREDLEFAAQCRSQAEELAQRVEQQAWDGQWFRRAYFGDGTPLGSEQNDECQIDSLPQSWSVISQAAAPLMRAGMKSVDERLVRRDLQLIQLFEPPFRDGPLDPGYIKSYPPGVRENGGQYTHAAVWVGIGFTLLGETERAWECFRMLNPVNHASSAAGIAAYKAEPYVVAADVYSVAPHEGRGGWTWYTGSAAWMYRWVIEYLLGIRLLGGTRLAFRPSPPQGWNRYVVYYRFFRSHYRIEFQVVGKPSHHVAHVTLDGVDLPAREVPLVDDGQTHQVAVTLGLE